MLPIRECPSPNVEPRRGGARPDILLLHYTGMASAEAALAWLCDPASGVSCHYLVDEAGGIVRMVDEDLRAWHAGEAFWAGATDINSRAIGIEIHHRGPGCDYGFPDAQMDAVIAVSAGIVARHAIAPQRVLAHSDVAPLRKIDPGERFDWRRLHEAGIGHWVEPAPVTDEMSSYDTAQVQELLSRYGYGLDRTGVMDSPTQAVLRAFQRHFRPARIDGLADASTIDTLERLLAGLPPGERHHVTARNPRPGASKL